MFDRDIIFALVAHIGRGEGFCRVASRLCRLIQGKGVFARARQIGDWLFCAVFDAHQRRRIACRFPIFGDHERDRLPAEHDPVVVEGAEW